MQGPPSARTLIVTFAVLVALAAVSWLAAAFITSSALAITIAAVKALAIALVFMELDHAHSTDRFIAAIAILFVVLLCVGAIADVQLR